MLNSMILFRAVFVARKASARPAAAHSAAELRAFERALKRPCVVEAP